MKKGRRWRREGDGEGKNIEKGIRDGYRKMIEIGRR
jgi:hypothetical protein